MISFFHTPSRSVIAVQSESVFSAETVEKLTWLFGKAALLEATTIDTPFIGPRREMITPWSTCAVEITQNMGIEGITRMEEYIPLPESAPFDFDPMLQRRYENLDQTLFTIDKHPEEILYIDDIATYNSAEGLALSEDEIDYLNGVSKKMERRLTDSELFAFPQVTRNTAATRYSTASLSLTGKRRNSPCFN